MEQNPSNSNTAPSNSKHPGTVNLEQFMTSYRAEIAERKLKKTAPLIFVEDGAINRPVPVRMVAIPYSPRPYRTDAALLAWAALEHELTFGVQVDRHNRRTSERVLPEHMQGDGDTRLASILAVTVHLSELSHDQYPVTAHIGTRLAELTGQANAETVRDLIMDTLHHLEMSRTVGDQRPY